MRSFMLFITLLSVVNASNYSDLQYIKSLISNTQYKKAYTLLDPLVKSQYVPSYIVAGNLLENGLGIKQNCSAAMMLYINAAKEGSCLAFKELARTAIKSKCADKKYPEIFKKFYNKFEECENKSTILK